MMLYYFFDLLRDFKDSIGQIFELGFSYRENLNNVSFLKNLPRVYIFLNDTLSRFSRYCGFNLHGDHFRAS